MNKYTKIYILLDSSSSMGGIKEGAKIAFDGILNGIKTGAIKNTRISVIQFADAASTLQDSVRPDQLVSVNYMPYGNTRLNDTLNDIIELNEGVTNTSFLVYLITDGENNRGVIKDETLSRAISNAQASGDWTFVFQVPPRKTSYFVGKYNLEPGNINEWEVTDYGVKEAEVKTSGGFANYFAIRSAGGQSTKSFYADLNGVSTRKLKNATDEVTDKCRIYPVKAKEKIKEFVERVTKRPYRMGSAYYKIEKTETVQARKDVLIVDKSTKKIYGGESARILCGLPLDREIKVKPVHSSEYDIYINSTSTNRLLTGSVIVKEI